MSFKDLTNRLKDMVGERGAGIFGARDRQPESNLGNGGASGYFPGVKERRKEAQETPEARSGYTQQMPPVQGQTGYTQQMPPVQGQAGYTQQMPPMQHTGYTQQMPPVQHTGYTQQMPPVQGGMGYTQQGAGYGQGYEPQIEPQQAGGYTAQFGAQGAQGGYAPQFTQQQQGGYAPQFGAQSGSTGYTQQFHAGYTQQQQGGYGQPQWQEPQQPQQQTRDNISYMPGSYVDDTGRAYVHVERVTQLVSFQACYRIIEFMKNGESVILNTESIPSESEIIRCIDMLSGAAYTLGCSITKITSVKRAYLIAPPTVQVTADVYIRRMSDRRADEGSRRSARGYGEEAQDGFDGYEGEDPQGYAQPQQPAWRRQSAPQGRRESAGYDAGYQSTGTQGSTFGGFGGFGGFGQ